MLTMNHNDHAYTHGMDMGGGHGGMDMGSKCVMNMIWNTQIIDTCVVFRQWHITSNASFVFSFFLVIGLGVAYEWLRTVQRRFDIRVARSLRSAAPAVSGAPSEEDRLLTGVDNKASKTVAVPLLLRLWRAALYGATIFLSFFLMLVFMTYNAYLILAVVLGAAAGHFIFSSHVNPDAILSGCGDSAKSMACH